MSNPSYYAILPANVRYDKNLKAMEKILYAEITALSNKDGYCSASNSYFAKLYEKSNETISRWISNLEKQGYLKVVIDTKKGNLRKIYPIDKKINTIDKNINTPIDKNVNTLLTKKSRPIDENVKQNNINTILQDSILQEENINNKKTNKETPKKFSIQTALQKSDIQQLLNDLKVKEDFLYELDNYRKLINKPIVSEVMLIAVLKDIREASVKTKRSANEIFTIMQEQGWKSVKAEWINNLEGRSRGRKRKDKEFERKELERFGLKFDSEEIIETNLIEGDIYG